MAFNGSGTFSRLYSWAIDAANNVNISSSRMDAELNGMAAGLTNCVTRDGQSPPSADLPMGGKRLTNLGAAAAGSDALNRDVADGRYSQAAYAVTFNNGGSGSASGAAFNGTANVSISYNSIGALSSTNPTVTGNVTLGAADGRISFTDSSGGHPFFIAKSDGDFGFYNTDATGAQRQAIAMTCHSSSSAWNFLVNVQGITPATADNSTFFATTAFVQANLSNATAAAAATYQPLVPRLQTVASAATVTPTTGNDGVVVTAQAVGLTLANPSGSPAGMQGIAIRIKDNGTPQTIAFGTQYRAVGVTFPTTTVAGKNLYLGILWNATDSKWDVVSVAQE